MPEPVARTLNEERERENLASSVQLDTNGYSPIRANRERDSLITDSGTDNENSA